MGNVHGGKQFGGENRKRITVVVSSAMHEKLLDFAKAEEKSVSDIVRDLLKAHLAQRR